MFIYQCFYYTDSLTCILNYNIATTCQLHFSTTLRPDGKEHFNVNFIYIAKMFYLYITKQKFASSGFPICTVYNAVYPLIQMETLSGTAKEVLIKPDQC